MTAYGIEETIDLNADCFDREIGVFGDPDYCVERVRALRREYGIDEFICYFNQGGMMDHSMVRHRPKTLARKVYLLPCRKTWGRASQPTTMLRPSRAASRL